MAGRPILALASLVFLAGAIVLQFFVILSGAVDGSPLNKVFFLQVNTRGITGQGFRGLTNVAWTYFALCPIRNDETYMCRGPQAAFPFDPQRNFGLSTSGQNQIPHTFINTSYYYLMSRFAWAFFLIALVFAVLSLFTGLLALCSRIGGFLSGILVFVALFFQAIAAALMTAWSVKGRNAFNGAGMTASLGKYAYGFVWGAFGALLISAILFFISGAAGGKKESATYSEGGKKSFFSRKGGSTRSRDGVKSEYS